jgi:hypothetical protein
MKRLLFLIVGVLFICARCGDRDELVAFNYGILNFLDQKVNVEFWSGEERHQISLKPLDTVILGRSTLDPEGASVADFFRVLYTSVDIGGNSGLYIDSISVSTDHELLKMYIREEDILSENFLSIFHVGNSVAGETVNNLPTNLYKLDSVNLCLK